MGFSVSVATRFLIIFFSVYVNLDLQYVPIFYFQDNKDF